MAKLTGQIADEHSEKWHEYELREQMDTPKRLEDVAKFLSGMISISLAIFFIGDDEVFYNANKLGVIIASIGWLLSLLLTLIVLFPKRYNYSTQSADSIKGMHSEIISFKYWTLIIAVFFYMAALTILSVLYLSK